MSKYKKIFAKPFSKSSHKPCSKSVNSAQSVKMQTVTLSTVEAMQELDGIPSTDYISSTQHSHKSMIEPSSTYGQSSNARMSSEPSMTGPSLAYGQSAKGYESPEQSFDVGKGLSQREVLRAGAHYCIGNEHSEYFHGFGNKTWQGQDNNNCQDYSQEYASNSNYEHSLSKSSQSLFSSDQSSLASSYFADEKVDIGAPSQRLSTSLKQGKESFTKQGHDTCHYYCSKDEELKALTPKQHLEPKRACKSEWANAQSQAQATDSEQVRALDSKQYQGHGLEEVSDCEKDKGKDCGKEEPRSEPNDRDFAKAFADALAGHEAGHGTEVGACNRGGYLATYHVSCQMAPNRPNSLQGYSSILAIVPHSNIRKVLKEEKPLDKAYNEVEKFWHKH